MIQIIQNLFSSFQRKDNNLNAEIDQEFLTKLMSLQILVWVLHGY